MNGKWAWVATAGGVVATVLSALAMHGKGAIDALAGVPVLLQAWASGLPLGIWSFLLSLSLATLVWATAISKLPETRCGKQPHFSADTISLLVAVTVTVTQQFFAAEIGKGKLLNALWLGLIAGLLAPYIGNAIRAVAASTKPKENK